MELLPVFFPEEQKPWYKRTDWAQKPEFWLKFAAYAIPGAFLLYVLYWNFLPFGYDQTFTIEVGTQGDTTGQFRLEPSRDLSERKTAPDGTTYRELNGLAFAVFEPKAVLKDATVTVTVEGDGVALTPLQLDFDPSSVKWDNAWDFTSSTPFTDSVSKRNLVGSAFPFDGCMYFDGTNKLELPYSANQFETGPFSIYVEWQPENGNGNAQEIIGHYNWELWQNPDSLEFRIRTQNEAYTVDYSVGNDFSKTKHRALVVYNPSQVDGYIALYIDDYLAGLTNIGPATITKSYGGTRNLSLGKDGFSSSSFFKGCIYAVNSSLKNVLPTKKESTFYSVQGAKITIPLVSARNSSFHTVSIYAKER